MKNITKSICILLLLNFLSINAQVDTYTGSLKGKIIDESTLQPLPFSNIYIEELETGTTSDIDGAFFVENIPEGKYNIRISYVGYNDVFITELRIIRNKTSYREVKMAESSFNLEGVEVVSFKYENLKSLPNSTFSLSREEIFRSPASNGNIFKAISVMPGVQSGGGSFSSLAVRGQGTEENAMFVEDFPVFEMSHLAGGRGGIDDPNGGRFSIFAPRVVDGLVLQTGGFSSMAGRRSSSYLNLSIKEGNPENPIIEILAGINGPSILYSGPTLFDNTQLFASVRYQNFTTVLNLTGQGDLGAPSFLDVTVKTTTDINKNNRLSILALLNPENFNRKTEHVAEDELLENNFLSNASSVKGLFGAKLRTLLSNKSNITNLVYFRFKNIDSYFGLAYPEFTADGQLPESEDIPFYDNKGEINSEESELGMRSIFSNIINEKVKLQAGVDFARVNLDHNRLLNQTDTLYFFYRKDLPVNQADQNYFVLSPELFTSVYSGNNFNGSIYANALYSPLKNLNFNAGLRYDYTGFSGSGKISPRLNGSYNLSEKTSINAAFGIYYQDPLFVQIADNNGNELEPERSIHYIAGVKHYLNSDLKLTVEGYYKQLDDLIVKPNSSVNNVFANDGDGFTYGVDVSLVKRLSNNVNGQISYSYSQSKRDDNDGLGEYDHLYSQPHLFNFLVSYQLKSKWVLSGKFRYSTGQPTNSSILHENIFENNDFPRYGLELLGRHDMRNDDFIGIDLRIDKRFQLRKFSINPYLDLQNVLNRENAAARTFYELTGDYKPQALGILPTLGIRFEI